MNAIKWLVDRECHVSLTDKQVIKWLKQRLAENDIQVTRSERRQLIQAALAAHHANQQLYELANHPNKKAVAATTAQNQTPSIKKGVR